LLKTTTAGIFRACNWPGSLLKLAPVAGGYNENAHVRAVEDLPRAGDAQSPREPTSSIPAVSMNSTGPMGSVPSASPRGRSSGPPPPTRWNVLSRHRVKQRTLPDVAPSEYPDVKPKTLGSVTHGAAFPVHPIPIASRCSGDTSWSNSFSFRSFMSITTFTNGLVLFLRHVATFVAVSYPILLDEGGDYCGGGIDVLPATFHVRLDPSTHRRRKSRATGRKQSSRLQPMRQR